MKTQTSKQKNSTPVNPVSAPVPNDSTPVNTVSTPVNTVSTPVHEISAPVNIQTPETEKELHYTRMETKKIEQKVKVQFTILSSRNGEETELDYGLARVYEKQGKVKIIN